MHRTYETEEISIFWNSEKCRHAKKCVTGSPEVFEFGRRPWIDPARGESAKIWQTVSHCPSGALSITYNHEVQVNYDEASCRAVAVLHGNEIGECDYEVTDSGQSWNIYHTHVLPEHNGKNIARRLVYRLLETAERRGITVTASCSYAARLL